MERTCKLGNGNTAYYNEFNGTCYETKIKLSNGEMKDYGTSDKLINVLDNCLSKGNRVRIWYGNKDTGRAWNEEYDVIGRIGRSCGPIKIPLLIANARSTGGGSLSVGCIVRVDDVDSRKTLYKQDNFHVERMVIEKPNKALANEGYAASVVQIRDDGTRDNIANFKSEKSAENYIAFMNGDRYCK